MPFNGKNLLNRFFFATISALILMLINSTKSYATSYTVFGASDRSI